MKFTGELKKKLEAAGSKEEAEKVLSDAGIELTDDELAGVAGGGRMWSWIKSPGNSIIPPELLPDDDRTDVHPHGHPPFPPLTNKIRID